MSGHVLPAVSSLTRHNLDKHEFASEKDTDEGSQTAMDMVVSEASSVAGEVEGEKHVDCGYHTDDDMYHPVYYMAIPPQVAPGTFIPALPTIPQSPMSSQSPSGSTFLSFTPVSRKTSGSAGSDPFKNRGKESETAEEKQDVHRKRAAKKVSSASCMVPMIQPASPASTPRQSCQPMPDRRDEPDIDESERTTVMLKNLPKGLSRAMLLELLDNKGFAKQCNFVYLPVEFTRRSCMGYAFVNFEHPSMVSEFWCAFEGLTDWPVPSSKICRVTWSSPLQGLAEHVDRFRNSPLMHTTVPDECRPILLRGGMRVPFPAPTKTLRAPRPRASRSMRPFWQGEAGEAEIES